MEPAEAESVEWFSTRLNAFAFLRPSKILDTRINMHPKLTEFVRSGEIPPTSKERNLLLDLARLILQQPTRPPQPELDIDAIRGQFPETLESKISSIS